MLIITVYNIVIVQWITKLSKLFVLHVRIYSCRLAQFLYVPSFALDN